MDHPQRCGTGGQRHVWSGVSAQWRQNRERGSPWLLRVMTVLSLRGGRRASRFILYGIASYFFLFAPRARRSSIQYLQRALQRRPTARDRFLQVLYFATTIHDRAFMLNGQFELFEISIEGEPCLLEAMAPGRGVILMGAHLGSFEVMRSLGQQRTGRSMVMVMYEDNARRINAALAAINPDARPEIIPLGQMSSMMRISERLDQNALVGLLADRMMGDEPALSLPFLGKPAAFPLGPMRAAALLQRPVIFMAGLYRGGNRYHLSFQPVADFSTVTRATRDAAIEAALSRYAALLEGYCRSDPYDWFNFHDFWATHPA